MRPAEKPNPSRMPSAAVSAMDTPVSSAWAANSIGATNTRRKTVGVRIPDHPVPRALLRELGSPLLSSTLLLPGHELPMTDGWSIKEQLDHVVDAVLDAGDCGTEPTTVVDWSQGFPEVVRVGAGPVDRFEA